MRTALLTIAAAVSAVALATPASAQWWPQPQGYGYGYHQNYGHVRSLQARVNVLQRHIVQLDRRNIITNREARRLRNEARDIERRLFRSARNGLTGREAYALQNRIQRLEYRIQRDAWDGRRHYSYRW